MNYYERRSIKEYNKKAHNYDDTIDDGVRLDLTLIPVENLSIVE